MTKIIRFTLSILTVEQLFLTHIDTKLAIFQMDSLLFKGSSSLKGNAFMINAAFVDSMADYLFKNGAWPSKHDRIESRPKAF